MWKVISGSAVGTSHQSTGQPCQDACRAEQWTIDGESLLAIVCCDGAGSARHAEQGAQRACDSLVELLRQQITSAAAFAAIEQSTSIAWCLELQARIRELADATNESVREFASTLLAILVYRNSGVCLQIGDGAIVTSADGSIYRTVFWPQSGEYINTTNFLTDECMPEKIAFTRYDDGTVNECAVFTDGLERLALHFATQSVHEAFFQPLFATLRCCADVAQLELPLRTFLDSSPVNERTDDDKSLVLATRLGGGGHDDALR